VAEQEKREPLVRAIFEGWREPTAENESEEWSIVVTGKAAASADEDARPANQVTPNANR